MPKFPLSPELDALHDEAIAYASAVQQQIAARGGCKSLSSEALNALGWSAVLLHRSVRTLCEEGWTPVTAPLIRSLLDVYGNCVAIGNNPADADYMGFKYLSHFFLKWLTSPGITAGEIRAATTSLNVFEGRLNPADQQKAKQLRARPTPRTHWFQPEYDSIKDIFSLSQVPIYRLFQMFSGPTHGGFDLKILMDDDMKSEDLDPRDHPKSVHKAIVASSRVLVEVCHIRDNWDNGDANEGMHKTFVSNLVKLRTQQTPPAISD